MFDDVRRQIGGGIVTAATVHTCDYCEHDPASHTFNDGIHACDTCARYHDDGPQVCHGCGCTVPETGVQWSMGTPFCYPCFTGNDDAVLCPQCSPDMGVAFDYRGELDEIPAADRVTCDGCGVIIGQE